MVAVEITEKQGNEEVEGNWKVTRFNYTLLQLPHGSYNLTRTRTTTEVDEEGCEASKVPTFTMKLRLYKLSGLNSDARHHLFLSTINPLRSGGTVFSNQQF